MESSSEEAYRTIAFKNGSRMEVEHDEDGHVDSISLHGVYPKKLKRGERNRTLYYLQSEIEKGRIDGNTCIRNYDCKGIDERTWSGIVKDLMTPGEAFALGAFSLALNNYSTQMAIVSRCSDPEFMARDKQIDANREKAKGAKIVNISAPPELMGSDKKV